MFVDKCLDKLRVLLSAEELRVYAYEFPTSYEKDAGKADLILEIVNNHNLYDKQNPLLILEFKKDKIKYGPVDQLKFYMKSIGPRLYRPNTYGYLVAPNFSIHEIEEALLQGFKCIQYDLKGNIKII